MNLLFRQRKCRFIFILWRYNLLPFTDTNSVICKIIVGGRTQFAPTKMFDRIRRGGLRPPVKCIVKGERYMKATGERWERRRWREERPERVAAVSRCQGALPTQADAGHRNRDPPSIVVPQGITGSVYKVKDHNFRCGLLCWHYLFSRLGQGSSCRPQQSGGLLQA